MKIPSLGRYSTVALLLVPVLLAVVLFAAVKRGSGPRDLRSALASARNAVPMGTEASLTYDDDSDYVVVSVTGAGLDGDSVSLASSARRVAEAVFGSQREGTFAEVGVLIWSGKGGRARPNAFRYSHAELSGGK